MIDSVSIRDIACFDSSGVQITDLKKINFIYGANGSGKTAISNFISNPTNDAYPNCVINWRHDMPLKTLIYNKQFRENNFGQGTIEGIFTLGQATKDEIEIIKRKQEELSGLKAEGLKRAETSKKQAEKKKSEEVTFKEAVWKKIYKRYEIHFKEAFKGSITKERFKQKILIEYDTNNASLLTLQDLQEKAKTIFGDIPETLSLINSISYNRVTEIENEEIWTKKIIGKSDADIAKMIQKLNLNDWVNQGRAYLQDNDNICPFCQQPTISHSFKEQLEDYFDETFTQSIKKINALKEEYIQLFQNVINELNQIETNEKDKKNTNLNVDTFAAYLKTVSSQFLSNKELLANKAKEPSRSIELVSTKTQLKSITEIISEANIKIKKHNKIVTNYQMERNDLIQSIWKYVVEQFREDIKKHINKTNGLQKGIVCLADDIDKKKNNGRILIMK